MHSYLHNYEDFLLIYDEDVSRASSRAVLGPKRRPRQGNWDDDEDEDFDSHDDDDYDDLDYEEDEDYGDYEDRYER